MIPKLRIGNNISKKLRIHFWSKCKLWKSVRNQLSSIIFIGNRNSMFPCKSDIEKKLIRCYPMHLCCFKFCPWCYIAMKGAFNMTTYTKALISIVGSCNGVFIFFKNVIKFFFFPVFLKARKPDLWDVSLFCHIIHHLKET